jgi:AcrR family transcriptional regulator
VARTDLRGGPATRARISEVATRLFVESGFDAVTVAEVAREAGVSSVTVFKHFPRKEDLFLDRAVDAAELLRSAVRDRAPGTDALGSLRDLALRLGRERHPLSGLADASVPFFRTVAASPALVARAREIAAELQRSLVDDLEQDGDDRGGATLLGAFVVAGYATVLVENARRLVAGEASTDVIADHEARVEALFDALRHGATGQAPPTDSL